MLIFGRSIMKSANATLRMLRLGIATDEPVTAAALRHLLGTTEGLHLVWLPASVTGVICGLRESGVEAVLIDMACGFPADTKDQLRNAGCAVPLILWGRDGLERADGVRVLDSSTVLLNKRAEVPVLLACMEMLAAGTALADVQGWAGSTGLDSMESPDVHVSPRESELMDLLTDGLSNRQLAEQMHLTEGSVKVYLSRLFHKLGVPDRTAAAIYAERFRREYGTTMGTGTSRSKH